MVVINDGFDYEKLTNLVVKQINSFYDISDLEKQFISQNIPHTFSQVESCFKCISNKYYSKDGDVFFNPYHNGQYTFFLYKLSRNIFLNDRQTNLCDKIYNLIKILSACDLFYQVELPEIFFFDHPLGSVLGRANYSDYFLFSQGCTIGNNKGLYPTLGEHVHLLSNSKVIGNSVLGDYVIVSANTFIKDENIPSYSLVFGTSPNLKIKKIDIKKYNMYVGSMFK